MADEGSLAQASVNGGSEHAASNGAAPPVAERVRLDDLADRVGQATGQAVRARPGRRGRHRGAPGPLAPAPPDRRPRRPRPRLHPREPVPQLAGREPLVSRRGPEPREHPGARPGAPGGQPHRRQPLARDDHLHARVLHVLRRRAPLPPARPQPGPGVAARPVPAPVRDRRRVARERPQGARGGRSGAGLPGWRLGGPPAELAELQDRLRREEGVRAAGARAGRPDRASGDDRRPGDGAVARSRRLARRACCASTRRCASRSCRS